VISLSGAVRTAFSFINAGTARTPGSPVSVPVRWDPSDQGTPMRPGRPTSVGPTALAADRALVELRPHGTARGACCVPGALSASTNRGSHHA
jgi:hypothetical protein